ncbi:MAG: DUF2007 domain-containing protein [Hymenobacter sp.]|nr:MAG: DUF2007 domain-containing protein [Hymenobacter sp.]
MALAAENIIVLGTYYNPLDAHLARTRLEAAGIACFLSNENLVVLNRMYSPAAGGVRLHVYEREAARAAEVLQEPTLMYAERGGAASTDAALVCPRCGSVEVTSETATRPTPGRWWATLRAWLRHNELLPGAGSHCFSCGLDF